MYKMAYLLLLFSLLLSGCRSTAVPLVVAATATTRATSKPIGTDLTLQPCTVGDFSISAKCGNFVVPEDRTNPNGRMLDLKVVVVPAREANPEPDPLFYVAGGPGTAATFGGYVNNAHGIFQEINAHREVVFLDQRGTNDKHRLTCELPSFPIIDAPQKQVDEWLKGCLASLSGDPRFYTTAEAMRDLDEAREALGYDKINLYGLSYGATAIQVYLRMFPEHVRAAVLDHGTALDVTFTEARPRDVQSAVEQVLSYCEKDEKCHAAYPDIRGDWKALLGRFANGPVVTNFTPPGETSPITQTLDDLAESARTLLLDSGKYATIPSQIHMFATMEDWTPLVEQSYSQPQSTSESEGSILLMDYIMKCFEPWVGVDADEIARLNQDMMYRDVEVKAARLNQKICASLPKPDATLIYPPGKPSLLKPLIINSLLDPQNPPANMEPALKEFPLGRMVIEPTEGHDPTDYGCRWDTISQYIQTGTADGLDTSCLEQQKPSFVIGN